MLKRSVCSMILLLLLIQVAFSLKVTLEKDHLSLIKGEQGKIKITLKNYEEQAKRYSLYLPGYIKWGYLSVEQIMLKPGEESNIYLTITSPKDLEVGEYTIYLFIEGEGEKYVKKIKVDIEDKKVEILKFSFEKESLEIIYKNGFENAKEEVMIYKGNEIIFKKERNVEVGKVKFYEKLNLEGGNYKVIFSIYDKNDKLIKKEEKILIVPFKKIEKNEEKWDNFFVKGERITLENKGNTETEVTLTKNFTWFQELFLDTSSYTDRKEKDGKVTYIWKILLAPSQKYEIKYKIDYTPLFFVILLLIILLAYIYNKFLPEIYIRKSLVKKVKKIEEGKPIKIVIEIGNRRLKEIKHVIVEEDISPIFEIGKKFVGKKPTKKLLKDKVKLIWQISKLSPKETLVFSYELIPKIGVKGGFTLPKTIVIYKSKGKRKKVESNYLEI